MRKIAALLLVILAVCAITSTASAGFGGPDLPTAKSSSTKKLK